MRPLPGDDAHGRARSAGADGPSTFRLPAAPQMTYFLGDESAISSASPSPPAALHRPKEHRSVPHTDISEHPKSRATSHTDLSRDRDSPGRPSSSKGPIDALRHHHHDGDDLSRPMSPFPRSSADTPSLSQPMTPVMYGVSGPASALSSVSSRRNSLCLSEDLGSIPPSMAGGEVAVEDDDEEEEEVHPGQEGRDQEDPGASAGSSMMDSGSAPQLVMPSIKMPSRRPFTDEGKRMGRLKVLVAGDSGVGKTSLVKAIVQSCEHIVHVDPITPSGSLLLSSSAVMTRSLPTVGGVGTFGSSSRQRASRRQSARESSGTTQITEVYASTKPYPEWWSEVDDLRVLRRRKSLGDAVLDRNICFVDTPGYGSGSSSMDTITPVAQYIEGHLQRILSNGLSDGDLLNLLGGEGGVQVDAVFYMVSNRLRPVDIEYLRQLSPLTNIIILLAQTDLMSSEQIAASKEQISCQLKEADVRLFSFSMPAPHHTASSDADRQGIYAVSSATGSDHDTMDASLLMSPDYVQPLIPTELAALVEHVFSSGGVARLRHAAARKYVQWRRGTETHPGRPSSLSRNLTLPITLSSNTSSLSSFTHLSSHRSPSSTPLVPQQHVPSTNLPPPPSLLPGSTPMTATTTANANKTAPATSYALARLADHAQREERLAQVRLANWAADLQRSLAREREQYAALARSERAVWLAERMGECVREGGLVPGSISGLGSLSGGVGDGRGGNAIWPAGETGVLGPVAVSDVGGQGQRGSRRQRRGEREKGQLLQQTPPLHQQQHHQQQQQQQQHKHRQDPLGLLEVADDLRRRGLVALEVLGSIGVLGGLALWVTRHYLHLQAYGWVLGEWERFWNGSR